VTIQRAYGSWVLQSENQPVCIAQDDVEEAGPWTITFSPVNVKAVGSPTPLTAQEIAAGVQPWQRAWTPFLESAVVLKYGAQGTEDITLDYPVTGGILCVWASTVQVAGVPPPASAVLPSAYYRPIGAATLARGDRASPRRRWTQTRAVVFDPNGSGIGLAPAPQRAAGYRVLFTGATDGGGSVGAALTVEQVALGTGVSWCDAYQRAFGFFGNAGVGSNLHRDRFVPLVDGATLVRFTQPPVAPVPPDPAVYPVACSIQWLLDL